MFECSFVPGIALSAGDIAVNRTEGNLGPQAGSPILSLKPIEGWNCCQSILVGLFLSSS